MGQQGIRDAGSSVSTKGISISFNLGDEPDAEFDSDYNPLRD